MRATHRGHSCRTNADGNTERRLENSDEANVTVRHFTESGLSINVVGLCYNAYAEC